MCAKMRLDRTLCPLGSTTFVSFNVGLGRNLFEGISLMLPTVVSLMLTLRFFGFPMYSLIYLLLLGNSFQAALSESIGTSKSLNSLSKPLGESASVTIPSRFSNTLTHDSALSIIHTFQFMNASIVHCTDAKITHPLRHPLLSTTLDTYCSPVITVHFI